METFIEEKQETCKGRAQWKSILSGGDSNHQAWWLQCGLGIASDSLPLFANVDLVSWTGKPVSKSPQGLAVVCGGGCGVLRFAAQHKRDIYAKLMSLAMHLWPAVLCNAKAETYS